MKNLHHAFFLLPLLAFQVTSAQDQAGNEELSPAQIEFNKIVWSDEGKGSLGKEAEITIPEGFLFTGREGTERYLKLTGNLVGTTELGIIAPDDFDWWVLFEFDDIGYVKDDEEIDSDKLLGDMMANDEAANEYRKQQGLAPIWIDGWAKEPFYNPETNNLEWAIRLRDDQGRKSVNYQTKLLGRKGVMEVVLVCGPDQLDSVLPEYVSLVEGFTYTSGNKYSEFQKGDKIAKYGLAALIAGGGAAVAAKTGLFAALAKIIAKGGKAVIVGIVAVFAGIWAGIKRLFGRG